MAGSRKRGGTRMEKEGRKDGQMDGLGLLLLLEGTEDECSSQQQTAQILTPALAETPRDLVCVRGWQTNTRAVVFLCPYASLAYAYSCWLLIFAF